MCVDTALRKIRELKVLRSYKLCISDRKMYRQDVYLSAKLC